MTLAELGLALLSNTLMALPLCGLAWWLTRRKRLPSLAHSLWLLALIKLVTPPLYEFPLPVPQLLQVPADKSESSHAAGAGPAADLADREVHAPRESASPGSSSPYPAHRLAPEPLAALLRDEQSAAGDPQGTATRALPESTRVTAAEADVPEDLVLDDRYPVAGDPADHGWTPTWSWAQVLGLLWGGGALFLFLRGLILALAFARRLRAGRPAPHAWRREARRLAEVLGLHRVPELRLVRGRVSPMLWCFFGRPVVVLPEVLCQEIGQAKLQTLLAHELAHQRRRDHWVRQFEWLMSCVLWFHPMVWWARKNLRLVEEDCCDAWVLWALPQASRCYADTLIDTIAFLNSSNSQLPAPASGMGQVQDLSRRLTMIMTGSPERRSGILTRGLTLGIATLSLVLAPVPGQHEAEVEHIRREAAAKAARASRIADEAAARAEAMVRDNLARAMDRHRAQTETDRTDQDPEKARRARALRRAIAALRKAGRGDDAQALVQMLADLKRSSATPDKRVRAMLEDRGFAKDADRAARQDALLHTLHKNMQRIHEQMAEVEAKVQHAQQQDRTDDARRLETELYALNKQMARLHEQSKALTPRDRRQREREHAKDVDFEVEVRKDQHIKHLFEALEQARKAGQAEKVRHLEHAIMQADQRNKGQERRRARTREGDDRIHRLEQRIDQLQHMVERLTHEAMHKTKALEEQEILLDARLHRFRKALEEQGRARRRSPDRDTREAIRETVEEAIEEATEEVEEVIEEVTEEIEEVVEEIEEEEEEEVEREARRTRNKRRGRRD